MNAKSSKNFILILIILALVIVGALGYFGFVKKTGVQPPADNQAAVKTIKTECPDAATVNRINTIIGEPTQYQASEGFGTWVPESFERLQAEFAQNPARCDVNEQYQIVFKVSKPFRQSEDGTHLIQPELAAYLYDRTTNTESFLMDKLSWAFPTPGGLNTYGPSPFMFEIKPNGDLDISYSYQSDFSFQDIHHLISLTSKKLILNYTYGGDESALIVVERGKKKWEVGVTSSISKSTLDPRTQTRQKKVTIKGIEVNGRLVKNLDVERIVSYEADEGEDFLGYGYGLFVPIARDFRFNQDYSKLYFTLEISIQEIFGEPGAEKINFGTIEVDLR